jgi:uncharacterized protein YlxW (UPF0749 family)
VARKHSVTITSAALMGLAGMVFAASATTAKGTDLRAERAQTLKQLVLNRTADVKRLENSTRGLQEQIDSLAAEFSSPELVELRRLTQQAARESGLRPTKGGGLIVTLNDGPRRPDDPLSEEIDPNWLLVHQQDIEAVINALWAGGATSISVMDERIVATSAVRCVGSTVLVNGRVFSPPFVIKAIGDRAEMRRSLNNDESVSLFRDLADEYGLTYQVTDGFNILMKEFRGSITTRYAKPIED